MTCAANAGEYLVNVAVSPLFFSDALLEDSPHDQSLPRYKRDLSHKLKILRRELQSQQPQTGHCRVEVNRAETFEQSYR